MDDCVVISFASDWLRCSSELFGKFTGQRDAKPMESRITFDAAANESNILLIFTMLQFQNIQARQPFYDLVSVQQKIE